MDIHRVLNIARISLSCEELDALKHDIERILSLFSEISGVEGEPFEYSRGMSTELREDIATPVPFDALSNVRDVQNRYIKVPKNL